MQSSLKPEKTRNLFQFRPEMSTYQVLSPKNKQNQPYIAPGFTHNTSITKFDAKATDSRPQAGLSLKKIIK